MKLILYSNVHLSYGKLERKLIGVNAFETLDPEAAILPNPLLSAVVQSIGVARAGCGRACTEAKSGI